MLNNEICWENLAKAIQSEEAIMGYRNTAENLKMLFEKKLAIVIFAENGEIITYGALWNTADENFLEVGSFWVHPDYREEKYSSEMFKFLSELIPKNKIAVCITHVDKVVHLIKKAGWDESTAENWGEVVPFCVSCEPCDVVSMKEKRNCLYKADKKHCRMFLKRG